MFKPDMEDDEHIASFRCEPEVMQEFDTKDDRATLRKFLQYLAQNGKVSIEIDQRYKLADVVQAHRDLEGRKTTGSTVLLP